MTHLLDSQKQSLKVGWPENVCSLGLRGKKAEKLRHEENWVRLTPNSTVFPTQLTWGPSSSSLETLQRQSENEVRMSMKCLVLKNCRLTDVQQFQCNPQMKRTDWLSIWLQKELQIFLCY